MRKWLVSMVMALGLPALVGIGVGALSLVASPKKAEAGCVSYRYCTWRYGSRYCYYKRRCYYRPRCYQRRRCYRRRYCTYGYGYTNCRYSRYCKYYRVCE